MDATISSRGAERVRAGHLWIYRSDVRGVSADARGGGVARVIDERRRFVGRALYSDRSEIALRILTQREEVIDRAWWRDRIAAAAARRAHLDESTNAYRVVFSEGDLLPSLIVDRYADVLVVQTLSQGTEAHKDELVGLLVEAFEPRAVVERNDVRVRALEGLEQRAGVLYGAAPEELEVVQHGVRFLVAPLGGQKTGSFLDQRENHHLVGRLARGRALDCFSFNGAFALHAAATCDSVLGLDISGDAVRTAERNAALNGFANVRFRETNVFDALREYETAGELFDTIILDPPAFAKNRASVGGAARGYKEINLRALKLLRPGGLLATCTCSYHMSEAMFFDLIQQAAGDARRRVQIVEKRTQAGDHPILVGVPETFYLKCFVLRVID